MIRTKFIQVRATEKEIEEISQGSKKMSIPLATFVRSSAIKEARKVLNQEVSQ